MKIHCKYDELKSPQALKQHNKNRNKHPQDQIDRLAKILEYQGWRYPIKVSNLSGMITSGHGRLMAALKLGLKEVPVNYQDYIDEDQEYADVQADNAIASWAELDLSAINLDIQELGPDLDIDMLGLKNFMIESADKFLEKELWDEDFEGLAAYPFKIILNISSETYRDEVVRLLKIKNKKNYKEGKVISIKWPEDSDL